MVPTTAREPMGRIRRGEVFDIELEGASEEEESEHAVEEESVEAEVLDDVFGPVADGGDFRAEGDQEYGVDEGEEHDADGDVDLQVGVADVAEGGSESDEEGEEMEGLHPGACSGGMKRLACRK